MLLPDTIYPEQSLYFNGAYVLKVLYMGDRLDLLQLYGRVKVHQEMSMPVFVLCLDWLFLAGAITLNATGEVELCS